MIFVIDSEKKRIQKHFDLKADCYESSAVLQREVCNRMLERLSWLKTRPEMILDAGAGTGQGTKGLMAYYKSSKVVAMDLSLSMLQQIRRKGGVFRKPALLCADAEQLPFLDASFDMVFSNLMLQWCDPKKVFKESLRILKPGGLLMFSTFGPDTLKELRYSWSKVDESIHVNDFIDMHDLGDDLLSSGFAEPVMDMDMMTLTYDDVMTVMTDLKAIGANTPVRNNMQGLLTPRKLQKVVAQYEGFRKDNVLPASFEIIYGHAWKTDKINRQVAGEIRIPFESVKSIKK